MISKNLKYNNAPMGMKVFKYCYQIVTPLLIPVIIVSFLFSLCTPKPGSNSRNVCILIFAATLMLWLALKIVNHNLQRSTAYRLYDTRTIRKLDLHNLVPLTVMALLILFPFYLLIISSLKTVHEANLFEFSFWPQEGLTLDSYKQLLQLDIGDGVPPIGTAILNSFVYAIIPCCVGLFSSSLAAYAFSKLQFKGSKTMYMMLLMTMMMPGCVTMASSYLMFSFYGWTNSPMPLIIPGMFGGAGTVLFLREFFMGIPNGLLEAAEIDGCGKFRSFFSIVLPLARPALTAQFILGFISGFNSYMAPLIYLDDLNLYTIQIAITAQLKNSIDVSLIAASGAFALFPMLALYILFQKTILSGISISSGLKG